MHVPLEDTHAHQSKTEPVILCIFSGHHSLTSTTHALWRFPVLTGATRSHRHLLDTINGNTSALMSEAQDSHPPDPSQPCYPFLSGPGSPSDGNFYMTATSKCPNDRFYVSFVYFPRNSSYVTYLAGADGTPTAGELELVTNWSALCMANKLTAAACNGARQWATQYF